MDPATFCHASGLVRKAQNYLGQETTAFKGKVFEALKKQNTTLRQYLHHHLKNQIDLVNVAGLRYLHRGLTD